MNSTTTRPSPWISREEVAKRVGLSAKRLSNMAGDSDKRLRGPPFWNPGHARKSETKKGGRVLYHIDLCDRWVMGDTSIPCGLQTSPFTELVKRLETAERQEIDTSQIVLTHHSLRSRSDEPEHDPDLIIADENGAVIIDLNSPPVDDDDDSAFWFAAEKVAALMLASAPEYGVPPPYQAE